MKYYTKNEQGSKFTPLVETANIVFTLYNIIIKECMNGINIDDLYI